MIYVNCPIKLKSALVIDIRTHTFMFVVHCNKHIITLCCLHALVLIYFILKFKNRLKSISFHFKDIKNDFIK